MPDAPRPIHDTRFTMPAAMTGAPGPTADMDEAVIMMLRVLAWVCSDADRAGRLLSLTGLDADALRAGADRPDVLVAVGGFLADHEADLVACATAIDVAPAAIIAAADRLGRA